MSICPAHIPVGLYAAEEAVIVNRGCETTPCNMAFPLDITLVGDSASTRTYSEVSRVEGNTVRKAATAPLDLPESMTIKHDVITTGGVQMDRHLVRFDLSKVGTTTYLGQKLKTSVYMNIVVPRDAVFTAAIIKDIRTQLINFIVDANITKLLNGEP